ncbi:MFS transporter [Xylophilus sp. Leaf220]|uniref:MFS transporter n=1 Tax=Xylophilus sp. Leaf220 TaxID=1735686 RepID=UPI0006F5AF50|nr:MFS transporter [Xylophilus sp. Leaf220]KQM71116.1 MFS transporter [Xylophilus sp. Leaf220]
MTTPLSIDVHEELAEARVGRLHIWLGVMMAALTLFDGYDTFNPAYVIHYVTGPWGLAPGQAGLLVSSGLVGFLVGAGAHGMVADRIGRRATLLGGLWITSLFTLATPLLADSFASFCGLRVLTGIGLGVLLPLATTYINELAPRRVANTFSLWGVAFGWALGGTLAGLVGVYLTPVFGWKVLYWIGSLSIPLTVALHFCLPESVKFLALKGRTEDIRALLIRLRPERAAVYRQARLVLPAVAQGQANPVAALLAPGLRRTTLTIWAAAFLSLFCIFGLTGWIPTVMMKRGETFAASFGFGALMQIMSFVGGLACGHLADRRGASRSVLATWWTLGGVAVLAMVFLDGHWVNLVCTAAAGFFVIGAQYVLNNFTAGAFQTEMRATAVGMMLSVGRLGAILGPFVIGSLQGATTGPMPMFVLIGCASIVAAIAIASLGRQASHAQAAAAGLHAHG